MGEIRGDRLALRDATADGVTDAGRKAARQAARLAGRAAGEHREEDAASVRRCWRLDAEVEQEGGSGFRGGRARQRSMAEEPPASWDHLTQTQ